MTCRDLGSRCRRGFAWACAIALVLYFQVAAAYRLFTVNGPWAKAGTRSSEAYMVLMSTEDATLIDVRSSLAARTSVHGIRRGAKTLTLPGGRPVPLRPGGERIVLTGLSRPLRLGDRVPLTLTIEGKDGARQEIAVNAEVRNESPVDAELRAHRH